MPDTAYKLGFHHVLSSRFLLAKTTFQTHSIVDHVMQSNISAVLAYTADSTSVISAYLTARHIVKNSRLFLGIAFGSPRSIV